MIGEMIIDYKVQFPKLLVLINFPIVMLGFKPVVPKCFIKFSKPYFKPTEGL